MDKNRIIELRDEIIARHGPWTAHNIALADGVFTMGPGILGQEQRLRRYVQAVADVVARPWSELRVLDLACLEGLYAIEFARLGARAVGIEGREFSVAKGRFVKEALGLENLEITCGDVRGISLEKNGEFDVVLCPGILYHLDKPDLMPFLENIGKMCTRMAIVETQISLERLDTISHGGRLYHGAPHLEHMPETTPEQRYKEAWSSLDNAQSFWFTRPSLLNALRDVGFTTVCEILNPSVIPEMDDHMVALAIKGTPAKILSAPQLDARPPEDWPEEGALYRSERFARWEPPAAGLLGRMKRMFKSRG